MILILFSYLIRALLDDDCYVLTVLFPIFVTFRWNERENSSPARAMKMADKLFSAVKNQLNDEKIDSMNSEDDIDLATSEIITKRQEERRKLEQEVDQISLELSEKLSTALEFRKPELIKKDADEPNITKTGMNDDISLTELFVKRDQTILLKSMEIITPNSMVTGELPDSLTIVSQGEEKEQNVIVTGMEMTSTSTGRTFSSAYAAVHDGKEPETTNWSIDFKE